MRDHYGFAEDPGRFPHVGGGLQDGDVATSSPFPPSTPLVRERLVRHRLTSGLATPLDVVRHLGAVQAQDYGQSLWAIATRMTTPDVPAVVAAIERGEIVRTWPMRGTIHWMPAEDAAWMVALSAERTLHAARARREALSIDDAVLAHADDVLTDALRGGKRMPRPELVARWESAGITTTGGRGYHLLWTLAHRGRIIIGPMAGKQQTFVLAAEFLPSAAAGEGRAELAARYLASHGPASAADVAWWTGTTLTASRAAIGAAADSGRVRRCGEYEDRDLWTGSDTPPVAVAGDGVRFLAGFDEYTLGYKVRDDVLAPAHFTRVVPGSNGVFQGTVHSDGVIVGTWRRALSAKAVDVGVELFHARSASARGVRHAAMAVADAYRVPLRDLSVTTVA